MEHFELVVLGLLKIEEDTADRDEELSARLEIAFAALDRIDALAGED